MMHSSARWRARECGAVSMIPPLAFDCLVHSDWSVAPAKRWTASALRSRDRWLIDRLVQTPPANEFLDFLFAHESTLAGFDFPIGLPRFYLSKTELNFRELMSTPASERTRRFFTFVETLSQVSPAQPFYRKHPRGGYHKDLREALGATSFEDLLRECDRATINRPRAESIFWLVGAKQVGKAALSGWQDILIPALARQARLWPFDGALSALDANTLTLAETYPAEVYRHIGMKRPVGKRSQNGRRAAGEVMLEWASKHQVKFSQQVERLILCGFGEGNNGEDPFDAVVGLCGMIEVCDGRRAEAPDALWSSQPGEGWILGQTEIASP
jgi:hypothetical protein